MTAADTGGAASWADGIARLLHVFLAGKRASTASAYRQDLQRLAEFLGKPTLAEAAGELLGGGLARATELATLYKGHLRSRSAATTVNRRLAALQSLTHSAAELGIVPWRLTVKPLPIRPLRDVRGPGREAVRAMVHAAKARGGAKGARDRAIVLLLYGLGLRRAEAVGLDAENVDLRRPAVNVMGKGRHEREWIEMPLIVQEAVAEWLLVRGDADGPLLTHVSRAHAAGRLTGAGLYDIVTALGRAVGVRATPHGLRHTAITDAILLGHSVADVQKFSRHANLNTLQVYYDRVRGVALDIANSIVEGL